MVDFKKYKVMCKKQEISSQAGFELLSKSMICIYGFLPLREFTVHSFINLNFMYYGNFNS